MLAIAAPMFVGAPTSATAGSKTIDRGDRACKILTPRGPVRSLCRANVRIWYCAGYEAGRLVYKAASPSGYCPNGFKRVKR